jgi:hypothetical protein
MRRWLCLSLLVATGCNVLFPEFFGGTKTSDASVSDGASTGDAAGPPHLGGAACVLADLRDYRSCAPANTGVLRITVEETRDVTMSDGGGHFSLALAERLSNATVAVVDPSGHYAISIVPVRLVDGIGANLALPLLTAAAEQELGFNNGVALGAESTALLVWAVDASGAPVSGVSAASAVPTLYDQGTTNQLAAGLATGPRGALALLALPPPMVALTLTTPPSARVKGDQFTLPLRAGAVTLSALPLPPR